MRLATGIWVSAYLHRLGAEGIFAHIMHRGDDTAGAVLVKQNPLDGSATLFQRSVDLMTGARAWVRQGLTGDFFRTTPLANFPAPETRDPDEGKGKRKSKRLSKRLSRKKEEVEVDMKKDKKPEKELQNQGGNGEGI